MKSKTYLDLSKYLNKYATSFRFFSLLFSLTRRYNDTSFNLNECQEQTEKTLKPTWKLRDG